LDSRGRVTRFSVQKLDGFVLKRQYFSGDYLPRIFVDTGVLGIGPSNIGVELTAPSTIRAPAQAGYDDAVNKHLQASAAIASMSRG